MKAQLRLKASASPAALRSGRVPAQTAPLPHQALMVARYGQRAAHVPVVIGPAIADSLRRRGAKAGSLDGVVFLPNARVGPDLVAHEVAHALQQLSGGADAIKALADLPALVGRLAHAPLLPEATHAESEARQAEAVAIAPQAPQAELPPGMLSLRRTVPTAAPVPTPAPAARVPAAPVSAAPAGSTAAPAAPGPAAPEAATGDIAPTFTPPGFVEPTLDPAVAAERAAAAEAGRAALAAADSPDAVLAAYATLAPSVQAQVQPELGARLGSAAATSNAALGDVTPAISVESRGGEGPLPQPAPVSVPADAAEIDLGDAAAPTVLVPEGPAQPTLAVDPAYGPAIERRFTESVSPERIDDSIDAVSTDNPGIATAVTDRAAVPQDGANDPQRLDDALASQRQQASALRQQAAQGIIDGPGPDRVVPRALDASAPAPDFPGPQLDGLAPAPGAAQLQSLGLDDTVVASFDQQAAADMQASADGARQQMADAQTARDTAHGAAVQQAEADRLTAEQTADSAQRQAVGDQRQVIQDQRQHAVDEQNRHMGEVNAEAAQARRDKRQEAQDEVADGQRQIDARYDQAEHDAEAEVQRGEREAAAERERKRKESEDASWWDRAVNFIRDAFEALVSLVTAIFDAIRSVVTGLIDLARRAVTGLISLVSEALQALVSALGTILKGLVDGLLGEIFPELAAALDAAIDDAVNAVNSAIDAVATTLVSAVNAVAGALTRAVNAVLDVFQAAVNSALAVLEAALTGDWGTVLRRILDAVLSVLGIDPTAFHALIAQASEAISIIVNDPGQFVSNMIDVVVGGVQLFADHFGEHLRRGIIGWLTGALGDIQIPNEWNLWTVLDLARQILGLTWDFVRERAARIIGRENVARLEMMASWIGTLITEGWGGLWHRIEESLASLRDSVLEAIRNFVMERVVMAAIGWLASLFNPVGALVKLVMTIWNIYQFVSAQLQRLFGIAQAVVGAISNIAHGVLDPGKLAVEAVLANLVPVVIDLLMSLLGVTGVAARVREIIQDLRQRIADAVDAMLQRVLGSLGLGRPAAASAGAPGAAAAGQIGHPVRIDVAEGEDHTLTIDRTGAGGATVMLHTETRPLGQWLDTLAGLAAHEPDAAKKTIAETKIGEARVLLNQLDPLADQAAAVPPPGGTPTAPTAAPAAAGGTAADRAAALEEQLGPILKQIFDNIGGGTDAFMARFRAELEALHPDARNGITRAIRADVGNYARSPDWAGVEARLMTAYDLLRQPYLATNAAFPTAARVAATDALAGHKVGLERRPTEDPSGIRRAATPAAVLRLLAENVHAGGEGAYGALHSATVGLILHPAGRSFRDITGQMIAAVAQATAGMAGGDAVPDARLAAALPNSASIIPFMTQIAKQQTVQGIDEAELVRLWPIKANSDLIKSRFRGVNPGQHEWIPTNYVLRIIQRASDASRAGEEAGEAAALWINVQNAWRSPTSDVIFKPQGVTQRTLVISRPDPSGTSRRVRATILQGHSGAIYAGARDTGLSPGEKVPQSEGQGPWHDELRTMFREGAAIGNSRAAITSIIDNVERFTRDTVWGGETSAAIDNFDDYYQSATGGHLSLSALSGRGVVSMQHILRGFRDARGVVA